MPSSCSHRRQRQEQVQRQGQGQGQRAAGARVGGEEMSDIRLPDLPLIRERVIPPEVPDLPEIPEVPEVPALPERVPQVPPVPRVRVQTPAQEFGRFELSRS